MLEELGLEYNIIFLDRFAVKKPFTDLNLNGPTAVIVGHNNDGFVLWEVCSPFLKNSRKFDKSCQSVSSNNPILHRKIRYRGPLDVHDRSREVSREPVVVVSGQ